MGPAAAPSATSPTMIFHDRPARYRDQQRGPEIGLAFDQINGNDDQHDCEREIGPADATLEFLEIPREHQRQRDLHQLRWLKSRDAEIEPAAGAVGDDTEERNAKQHQHRNDVQRNGRARERLRRNVREQPHQRDREAEAQQLARHTLHTLVGRGKERDDADADDRERAPEQHAIDPSR